MAVITMISGSGAEIYVDPENVDAVHYLTELVSGLRIGTMTVAVQGKAEAVAKKIEDARGRSVFIVERSDAGKRIEEERRAPPKKEDEQAPKGKGKKK